MKKRTIMMIRKRRKRCKRNDGKSLVIIIKNTMYLQCVCALISCVMYIYNSSFFYTNVMTGSYGRDLSNRPIVTNLPPVNELRSPLIFPEFKESPPP